MNYFDCNRADSRAVVVNNCPGTKCKAAAASLTAATSMELTITSVEENVASVITYYQRYKVRVLTLRSRWPRAVEFPPRIPQRHVSPRSPSIGCTFGCWYTLYGRRSSEACRCESSNAENIRIFWIYILFYFCLGRYYSGQTLMGFERALHRLFM